MGLSAHSGRVLKLGYLVGESTTRRVLQQWQIGLCGQTIPFAATTMNGSGAGRSWEA